MRIGIRTNAQIITHLLGFGPRWSAPLLRDATESVRSSARDVPTGACLRQRRRVSISRGDNVLACQCRVATITGGRFPIQVLSPVDSSHRGPDALTGSAEVGNAMSPWDVHLPSTRLRSVCRLQRARSSPSPTPLGRPAKPVRPNPAVQMLPADPQVLRGARDVPGVAAQHRFQHLPLELDRGLLERARRLRRWRFVRRELGSCIRSCASSTCLPSGTRAQAPSMTCRSWRTFPGHE